MRQIFMASILGLLCVCGNAQENPDLKKTFYLHGSDTAVGLGYLAKRPTSQWLIGLDLSGEGERRDRTYYRNELKRSTSFNLLWGYDFANSMDWRAAPFLVIGVRSKETTCSAQSYLGYQCYADSAPEQDYTGNFGLGFIASYRKFSLGVRATDVSESIVFGWNF